MAAIGRRGEPTRGGRRRRGDRDRSARGSDADQSELDRLQPAGLAPLPDVDDVGAACRRSTRFVAQLPPRPPHRAAARRAGIRRAVHVLFDAPTGGRSSTATAAARPPTTSSRQKPARTLLTRPDRAWQALADSTATHAVVHEAFLCGRPRLAGSATGCAAHGAAKLAAFGSDRDLSAAVAVTTRAHQSHAAPVLNGGAGGRSEGLGGHFAVDGTRWPFV